MERLGGQMHQDAAVLPDRIQQDRSLERDGDFTKDLDRLGFEAAEVRIQELTA